MKTIATAAVLMMLSAPAWADESGNKQTNELASFNEPIVLSEAEMDGVTAGANRAIVREPAAFLFDEPTSSTQIILKGTYVGAELKW